MKKVLTVLAGINIFIFMMTGIVFADCCGFKDVTSNELGSTSTIITFDEVSTGPVNDAMFSNLGVVFTLAKTSLGADNNAGPPDTGNFLAEGPYDDILYILSEGSAIGEGIIKASFSSPVGGVGAFGIDVNFALVMRIYDSNDNLLYKTRAGNRQDNFVGTMSSENNIAYVTFEFDRIYYGQLGGYGINDFMFNMVPVLPAVPLCEGDFDGDGDVDGSDLAVFSADFGRTDCPQ